MTRGMRPLLYQVVGAALLLLAMFAAAHASPVTPDSFNAEHGGVGQLNYSNFHDFTVTKGSVDLIGNGYYDAYAGNGLYVDMAGSTNHYGQLTTKANFTGDWVFTFGLGGTIYKNDRTYGSPIDGVNIKIGSFSQDYILNPLATETITIPLALGTPTAIVISDLGLSGNADIGATLFGFTASEERYVPEPQDLALFGTGLLGLLLARRRQGLTPA